MQSPFVDFEHFVVSDGVFGGVEIVDVAEEIADGVPDFAVGVLGFADEFVVAAHIVLIVDAGDPEAEDVRAVFGDFILSVDVVAEGLGLLHTLFIDGEAVGENGLERRFADCAESG